VLLFVGAVILPSAVLLAATVRLGLQERELDAGRRAERRALLGAALGRELVERLELLRARALDGLSGQSSADPDSALLLVARVRDGRLVFPWDEPLPRARRTANAEYTNLLDAGEAAEFGARDFAEAARLYGQAATAAGADTMGRAEAWLRLARTRARAGRAEAARAVYRQLAVLPGSVRDEDGMPVRLYAAEGLLQAGLGSRDEVRGALSPLTEARRSLGPTALFALRDLTGRVDSAQYHAVASWIVVVERSRTLERDLPGLLAAPSGDSAQSSATPWYSFGPVPWLASTGPAPESREALAVVAEPTPLLRWLAAERGPLASAARSVRLTRAPEPEAEELGPAFPGLRAVFTDPAALGAGGPGVGPRLFLLVLPVVAGLTLFGAWLLWRDVVREVGVAKLRSQILASVSHELKTPLTSIRMFAETLLLGRSSREAVRREYLKTILHESERLTRLINNVLGFSRIEAGQQQYHRAPTDLSAVAREAAHAMEYPLAEGGFELELSLPDHLPVIRADRDALIRAVLNLLSNAMKFSGEHRRIALSVAAENGDALVRVRDRGRGIAPEDRERIFDPFFRAHDVEEDNITGTGLGLSLVAHVAQAHGGRVEVESAVGEGSTFTIRLPLERSA
jgi:signal transduction histidine kinase